MYIQIDGAHEKALLRLVELNGEKSASGMMRLLVRDAAKEAGVWQNGQIEASDVMPHGEPHGAPMRAAAQ